MRRFSTRFWLSETGGNKDGLQFKEVHQLTLLRYPCVVDSVRKSLQELKLEDPYPRVESWEAVEQEPNAPAKKSLPDPGRRPNLWLLEPKHLVTLPVTAMILQRAYQWPYSWYRCHRVHGTSGRIWNHRRRVS